MAVHRACGPLIGQRIRQHGQCPLVALPAQALMDIEQTEFNSTLGVVTDIAEADGNVTIFYIRDPKTITASSDNLEIGLRWETAMENYIVGNCFLDDLDTQYQARGAAALQLYDRELQVAKRAFSRDSTRSNQYQTDYNGGF